MDEQGEKKMDLNETGLSLNEKLLKLMKKHKKMHQNVDDLLIQTINAIQKSESEVLSEEKTQTQIMNSLHEKIMEIKPLKSLKDQYNDFYKKLSGTGKSIEEASNYQLPILKSHEIFDQSDYKVMQNSIADHYMRSKNYEIAQEISPNNQKRKVFQECQLLKNDILTKQFNKACQWAQSPLVHQKQKLICYQIKKQKIIFLVNNNKGNQALQYYQKQMHMYIDIKEQQIKSLISYILMESSCLWGELPEQDKKRFRKRYENLIEVRVEELAMNFQKAFYRINDIAIENPVTKCHYLGLKYQQQFLDKMKYLSHNKEMPKTLPFAMKVDSQDRFHSQFYCPVSKQVYGVSDKNIILKCGHIISNLAHIKILQNRNTRRKLKCPVCQEDQAYENPIQVKF